MYSAPARQHARVKSRQKAMTHPQPKPDFCVFGAVMASALAVLTAASAVLVAAKSRKKHVCKCK